MCQSQSVGLGSYERAGVEVNRMELQKRHEDRYRKVIVILLKSPCCGLKLSPTNFGVNASRNCCRCLAYLRRKPR